MIKPITIWSSSELDTSVSTILPAMVSTFSGQILFKELCTERLSSSLRSARVSRWGLYAVAEGVGNAGRLLLLPAPTPRASLSRCLDVRLLSRCLCCKREPNILRSLGSPALAAAGSAAAADGQAMSSRVAHMPARVFGMGPARLRKAMSELRPTVTAAMADLETSSSVAELLGLTPPAFISSSSEDVEGVQVSSSTSWARTCLASSHTGLVMEATPTWTASANWCAGMKVAFASGCQSLSSQLSSSCIDGWDCLSSSSMATLLSDDATLSSAAGLAGAGFWDGLSCQSSSSQPSATSSASLWR
mmetsp:Transcript_100005/g.291688  ORF Transcript_100005/g.291688 Transcript_100005/m.291688 type:complete len:304 (+) Transcript_100005:41-952(+)